MSVDTTWWLDDVVIVGVTQHLLRDPFSYTPFFATCKRVRHKGLQVLRHSHGPDVLVVVDNSSLKKITEIAENFCADHHLCFELRLQRPLAVSMVDPKYLALFRFEIKENHSLNRSAYRTRLNVDVIQLAAVLPNDDGPIVLSFNLGKELVLFHPRSDTSHTIYALAEPDEFMAGYFPIITEPHHFFRMGREEAKYFLHTFLLDKTLGNLFVLSDGSALGTRCDASHFHPLVDPEVLPADPSEEFVGTYWCMHLRSIFKWFSEEGNRDLYIAIPRKAQGKPMYVLVQTGRLLMAVLLCGIME